MGLSTLPTVPQNIPNLQNQFDPQHIQKFTPKQIKAITPQQIQNFTPEQIKALTNNVSNIAKQYPNIVKNIQTKLNGLNQKLKNGIGENIKHLQENINHIISTIQDAEAYQKYLNQIKEEQSTKLQNLIDTLKNDSTIDEKLVQLVKPLEELQNFMQKLQNNFSGLLKKGGKIADNFEIDLNNLKEVRQEIANLQSIGIPVPKQIITTVDNYIGSGENILDISRQKIKQGPEMKKKLDASVELINIAGKNLDLAIKGSKFLQKHGMSIDGLSHIKTEKEAKEYFKKLPEGEKIGFLEEGTNLLNGEYDKKIQEILDNANGDIKTINKDIGIITGDPDYLNKLLIKKGYLKKGETVQNLTNEKKQQIQEFLQNKDSLLGKGEIGYDLKKAGIIQIVAKKLGLKAEIITDTSLKGTVGVQTEKGYVIIDTKTGETYSGKSKKQAIQNYNTKNNNFKLYTISIDTSLNQDQKSANIKLKRKFRTTMQNYIARQVDPNGQLSAFNSLDKGQNDYGKGIQLKADILGKNKYTGDVTNGKFTISNSSEHLYGDLHYAISNINGVKIENVGTTLRLKLGDKNNILGQLDTQAALNYFMFTNPDGNESNLYTLGLNSQYTKRFGNEHNYIEAVAGVNAKATMEPGTNKDNFAGKVDGEISVAWGVRGQFDLYRKGKNHLTLSGQYSQGSDVLVDFSSLQTNPQLQLLTTTKWGVGLEGKSGEWKYGLSYSKKVQEYLAKTRINISGHVGNEKFELKGNYSRSTQDGEETSKSYSITGKTKLNKTTSLSGTYKNSNGDKKIIAKLEYNNPDKALSAYLQGSSTIGKEKPHRRVEAGVKWKF